MSIQSMKLCTKKDSEYIKNRDRYVQKCIKINNIELINEKFKFHKSLDDYHVILSFTDNGEVKYYTIKTDNINNNMKFCFSIPIESSVHLSDGNGKRLDDNDIYLHNYGDTTEKAHYGICYDLMTIYN